MTATPSAAERAAPDPAGAAPARRKTVRAAIAWAFYDWANSPFTAVVTTFVFATYFTESVAADKTAGSAQWGFMQGAAALLIAVLSPILGAIADHAGRRKPWLLVCTLGMAAGSALLWFVQPQAADAVLLLLAVGFAIVAFEIGTVFYNAMLPGLVPANWIGRVSGWAWGLGYFGGLACLLIVLFVFIQVDTPPFGLDKKTAEHVRIGGPIVAVWTLLFAIPIFLYVPDRPSTGIGLARAAKGGLAGLWRTFKELRKYREIARFLLAKMIYIDGINTLFIFGGVFAAVAFGMTVAEVALFGVVLNITAGLGAVAFGWIDARIGARNAVLVAIAGITLLSLGLLLSDSKLWFWILGSAVGIFFGPAQAASRTMMALMAPKNMETEMFGLFAFAGKATAFLGPWLVGIVTALTDSLRWGMAVVVPMMIIGGILLCTVKTPRP